jgi:S1-C subfamily serine protease
MFMPRRSALKNAPLLGRLKFPIAAALALAIGSAAQAEPLSFDELLSGIVRIKTFINPDGTTVGSLGRERSGSGIVIDNNGLVLTIGYLMVEAHAADVITNDGHTLPANVVGYDQSSGFGLLRTMAPIKARPMELGKSADIAPGDRALAVSSGGRDMVLPVNVVATAPFAGSWEYLLDKAIFTAPAHPEWSGAALINREGKLVGVGSLIVHDATRKGDTVPGNMFVPIDLLPPILSDLIDKGHTSKPPRPWLGVSTDEMRGHLIVSRVTRDGPAERAGLLRGDIILAVNGVMPDDLADFYRKVWALGSAGAIIPLDVVHGGERRHVDIKSMNQLDHLRLKTTF